MTDRPPKVYFTPLDGFFISGEYEGEWEWRDGVMWGRSRLPGQEWSEWVRQPEPSPTWQTVKQP